MRSGILLILLAISLHVEGSEPRRVLLIHSFGQEFQPFITFSADFRAGVARQLPEPVDFFDVALAEARFETREEDALVNYLNALFAGRRPDLVVPMGAPAVGLAQKYRDRLFPDTPMLITCVDQRRVQNSRLTTNDAVIAVRHEPRQLVEAILRLMPDTTNVVLVFGSSPLERLWSDDFMRECRLTSGQVECETFSGLSLEQMKQRAAALPRGSVLLFGDLLVDGDGIPQTGDEALANLHEVAAVPIFGIHDFQLGHGIVGGPMIAVHELANQSASTAARILKGESPAGFRPPPMGESVPTYDWRELRRWGISEDRLPPGSIVRHVQATVWEQHKKLIGLGILLALVLSILIGGTIVNLNRRLKAERVLRESEQRFRVAADSAPVLIWMSGVDKKFVFFNRRWHEFTGRSIEQTISDGWMKGVHPDDASNCLKIHSEAFDGRRPFTMEYRMRRHDGQYRWLLNHGVPRYDAQKKFLGYIGSCVDVTERLEAELEARRWQLELAHVSRLSTLWALAGSLAHELRQPLSIIVNSAEAGRRFMAGERKNDGEVLEALKDIAQQGQLAGDIITEMRGMLKRDPGKMEPQDLNLIVRTVVEMLRSDLVSRQVTPVLRLDPQLPPVNGHGVQLRQALLNLVLNACDAMAEGRTEQRTLTIESKRAATNGDVEVSVADTGPGFAEEMLRSPFEPFRTTKVDGLGLGLAICRSIITAHDGRMTVTNNGGTGATIKLTLPGEK